MANRRISEFPAIDGGDIDEEDLMTLVHVYEVDPQLRNKKITFTQFRAYLDDYFATTNNPTLSGTISVGTPAVYANNAAAKAGGLVDGNVYRKSDGTLMVVYT